MKRSTRKNLMYAAGVIGGIALWYHVAKKGILGFSGLGDDAPAPQLQPMTDIPVDFPEFLKAVLTPMTPDARAKYYYDLQVELGKQTEEQRRLNLLQREAEYRKSLIPATKIAEYERFVAGGAPVSAYIVNGANDAAKQLGIPATVAVWFVEPRSKVVTNRSISLSKVLETVDKLNREVFGEDYANFIAGVANAATGGIIGAIVAQDAPADAQSAIDQANQAAAAKSGNQKKTLAYAAAVLPFAALLM